MWQRPRLLKLEAAGADIYLCRGRKGRGSHHKKAVVVDGRTAYVGGANLTNQAADFNGEMWTRFTGFPVAVADVLCDLEECKHRSSTKRGVS